jgi:hypothetical protein
MIYLLSYILSILFTKLFAGDLGPEVLHETPRAENKTKNREVSKCLCCGNVLNNEIKIAKLCDIQNDCKKINDALILISKHHYYLCWEKNREQRKAIGYIYSPIPVYQQNWTGVDFFDNIFREDPKDVKKRIINYVKENPCVEFTLDILTQILGEDIKSF